MYNDYPLKQSCHTVVTAGLLIMSSIRKRGSKRNVQIRRSGLPNLSRTFILKTDAEKWATAMEAALDILPSIL